MNFAYFHSINKYGIIIWGNSTNTSQVLKIQKRILMSGVGTKSSCRNLFKKLDNLPTSCQYIQRLADKSSAFTTSSISRKMTPTLHDSSYF